MISGEKESLRYLFRNRKVKGLCKFLFDINLTPKQEEIVRTIAFGEHKRVVIACMTRYGKSYSVSLGLLLWILGHQNKRLVIIAPTQEKTTIIRNYMANFIAKSPIFMALLDVDRKGKDWINKEVSRKRMTWKNGIEMRTLTAEGEGIALMGFGADLVVVDESCDIKYEVYRSKISRMLGDNPEDAGYIEIGNPLHRDNHMWQHWIDPDYYKIHIGWKVALEEGRTTEEFIKRQQKELTPQEFKILYEAEFPEETEDQLISWNWINKAIRKIPKDVSGEKRISVDVARFGQDLTVITKGFKYESLYVVEHLEAHAKEDTMTTVGRVLKILNNESNIKRICVDTDGLGGGVSDRLQELKNENLIEPEVVQFHGGKGIETSEEDKKRFLNQKSQAYFHLRKQFESGNIIILDNAKLKDQLSKMKWKLTSSNKIRILDPGEGDEDTSEKKSPDFADSLCYFTWDLEPRVYTII
jgi:hypothetical protein